MNNRKNLTPLILGLILVISGGLFLAANIGEITVEWFSWLKYVLPFFLVAWGLAKLVRHFLWEVTRLAERPGRSSLLSGLFWTCIGLLWFFWLLDLVQFSVFFGTYWPILLVLFGLGKVVDYYRLRGEMQFRAAEIVGLLFVIFLGLTVPVVMPWWEAAAGHLRDLRGMNWGDDLGIRIGPDEVKHSWTAEKSLPAAGLEELEVVNLYGDVTVEAGEPDAVDIRLTKVVYESSQEKARELADRVEISTQQSGGTLKVGTNRNEVKLARSRFLSHLVLTVPSRVRLKLANSNGNVSVRNLDANCQIENAYGDVEVSYIGGNLQIKNQYRLSVARHIRGDLKIENNRGTVRAEDVSGDAVLGTEYDSVSARRIGGSVQVSNRFGQVRIGEVTGSVTVESPGSEVNVSDVAQPVSIRNSYKPVTARGLDSGLELDTSYSRVSLSRVGGPVEVRATHAEIRADRLEAEVTVRAKSSQVELSEIMGPFDIATSLRSVSVRDFSRAGEVKNEHGEIILNTGKPLVERLSAANKNGRISLFLPAEGGFNLSAQAPGGSILSDFGTSTGREATPILEASIAGGGPEVRLQTTYSQIQIKKR